MSMISDNTKVIYYSSNSSKPIIISPKNDNHWSRNKNIDFVWVYKGYDTQMEFVIQILKIEEKEITPSILSKWTNNEEIDSSYIYEINEFSSISNYTTNVSEAISSEGMYRWRIKTRGVLAKNWSPWTNDGFVNIDYSSPVVKNVSIVSPSESASLFLGEKVKLAASISDMSAPWLRSRRSNDEGYDNSIDRNGYPGLYINYDYRDNSLVLRVQGGETKKRYYGLMSFHSDSYSPLPSVPVQDAIKMGYVYTINKGEEDGIYQKTSFKDMFDGKGVGNSLDNIIYTEDILLNTTNGGKLIPKGFPKFWTEDIFSEGVDLAENPASFSDVDNNSFFSVFPFNTHYVKYDSGKGRMYRFPDGTYHRFNEFVELRYPYPYDDIFILFKPSMKSILLYGQFNSRDSIFTLADNPNYETSILLSKGYDVEANRKSPPNRSEILSPENRTILFYNDANDSAVPNPIISRKETIKWDATGNSDFYPILPKSYYLFFNLAPDVDGNDMAIKLYLNNSINKNFEQGSSTYSPAYVEFYFRPDSDCSLEYKGTNKKTPFGSNQEPISIDEIFIGNSRITPKALPMYEIDLTDESLSAEEKKYFYKYVQHPDDRQNPSSRLNAEVWGNEEDYFRGYYLNRFNKVMYNGSFRIKLPKFDFIPYYHPEAVAYSTLTTNKPVPYFKSIDVNKDSLSGIINWDSINVETSNINQNEPSFMMKGDYLSKSDFIKIEGISTYYGQINPYLYNFLDKEDWTFPYDTITDKGSILRINSLGWLSGTKTFGPLGFSLYEKGWSPESIWFNTIDNGYYGISEIEPNIKYIEGSLHIFLNGKLLTKNIKRGPFTISAVDSQSRYSARDISGNTSLYYLEKSLEINLNGIALVNGVDFQEVGDGYNFDFKIGSILSSLPTSLDEIEIFYTDILERQYSENKLNLKEFDFVNIGEEYGIEDTPSSSDNVSLLFRTDSLENNNPSIGPYFANGETDKYLYSLRDDFGIGLIDEEYELGTLKVFINGLIIRSGIDYREIVTSGETYQFELIESSTGLVSLPTESDIISVWYNTKRTGIDNYEMGPFSIKGNGTSIYRFESDFNLDSNLKVIEGSIKVFINGIMATRNTVDISSYDYTETTYLGYINGFILQYTLSEEDIITVSFDVEDTLSDDNTSVFGAYKVTSMLGKRRYAIEGFFSNVESKIRLKDFTNFLFRSSLNVNIEDSLITSSEDYTTSIKPVRDDSDKTYIWNSGSVLNQYIQESDENGKIWSFNKIDSDNMQDYIDSLIANDSSVQSYYGDNDGVRDTGWMLSQSNIFGGYYLLSDTSSTNRLSEQIIRTIVGSPDTTNTLSLRSPFHNEDNIPLTTMTNKSYFSGEVFSIGNIFGYVSPKETEDGKTIRIFIDTEESVSGINGIKILLVDLEIEETSASVESPLYFASKTNDLPNKIKIPMQKINNEAFEFSDLSSIRSAISLIETHRSPLSLIDYYFNNKISNWNSVSGSSSYGNEDINAGYGLGRFYYDINVSVDGYKLLYVQVKDKSGNVSNISMSSFYVGDFENTSEIIVDAYASVDEEETVYDSSLNILGNEYHFEENIISRDKDRFRTIAIHRPLADDSIVIENELGEFVEAETYKDYSNQKDILCGLSDNYGLSYNLYSPFSSAKSWRFDRPISIKQKSFINNEEVSEVTEEPDWFFDPNDIRHYPPDSSSDYIFGVGNYNNTLSTGNSWPSFHLPGNATLESITLIGLRATSTTTNQTTWGKANPIANKIFEFKEEFIGKKIVLGGDSRYSFSILHIFKTEQLTPIKKWKSNSELDYIVDGDNHEMVWIVISDSNALAALMLSRKFQYIDSEHPYVSMVKTKKGHRDYLISTSYTETSNFGYYQDESSIPQDINDQVNSYLGMTENAVDGGYPISKNNGSEYFFIVPSESIDDDSGIETQEGWITQIFNAYDEESSQTSRNSAIFDKINKQHSQLLGITISNRLVFGKKVEVYGIIESVDSVNNAVILADDYRIDRTMIGKDYSIVDISSVETEVVSGNIVDISSYSYLSDSRNLGDCGKCVILDSDVSSSLDEIKLNSGKYKIKLTIDPIQSTDLSTGELFEYGWWPDIQGVLVPPIGNSLGLINSTNYSLQKYVQFAIVSNGAFYIDKEGYYGFKIDSSGSYADLTIDYMNSDGDVYDIFEIEGSSLPYEERIVGGSLRDTSGVKEFYLRKGWHAGRFRYISKYNTVNPFSAVVYMRKPSWGEEIFTPIIGSENLVYPLMARGYRSIHCRFLDRDFNEYPVTNTISENKVNTSRANQYFRAMVGFYESLISEIDGRYANQILLVEEYNDDYGYVKVSNVNGNSMTYGGQMFEEAYGIYESSIIDGGADFRFWRNISWTVVSQPDGTDIEFYIRTSETEEELLSRTWNNIGDETESGKQIIPAFVISGSDILAFSQQFINVTLDEIKINRFLQFKMVLRSRINGVTPVVNDVTIAYSKLNTVNFFSTTFNLSSNILRGILTYNGEIPEDENGYALADIQFGICTKEESEGIVSTNFDNYELIPVNAAFNMSDLGLNAVENDKFRIGIRFLSTENSTPFVDDFAFMWETKGKNDRTKDLP